MTIEKPKKRPAARQKEGSLSDAIGASLAHEPGLKMRRNSVGVQKSRGRYYHTGMGVGSADKIGILAVDVKIPTAACPVNGEPIRVGRFVALEIKNPGEIPTPERIAKARAKPAPTKDDLRIIAQEAYAAEVRSCGGFYAYIDSVEGAHAAIARARRGAVE